MTFTSAELSKKHVVVALDDTQPEKALTLITQLKDSIDWFKIGPALFNRAGVELLRFLKTHRKNIFLDLKLHDTPSVMHDTVKHFASMGIDYLTVHLLGGTAMLRAAAEGCRGSKLRLLGVSLLTSQQSSDLQQWGVKISDSDLVLKLVDQALEARLAGCLCSPQELTEVKPRTLPGFMLFTPGIRIPGREVYRDDQKRVSSARQAIEMGADYLVVGRPVTQARDPREALDALWN